MYPPVGTKRYDIIVAVVLLICSEKTRQNIVTRSNKTNAYAADAHVVRCLSGLNVHFCKKSPKLAQITFDRYLSNPDIGRTFYGGLTPSN